MVLWVSGCRCTTEDKTVFSYLTNRIWQRLALCAKPSKLQKSASMATETCRCGFRLQQHHHIYRRCGYAMYRRRLRVVTSKLRAVALSVLGMERQLRWTMLRLNIRQGGIEMATPAIVSIWVTWVLGPLQLVMK